MRWLIVGLLVCMLGGETQVQPVPVERQFKSTMAEMLEHTEVVSLTDAEKDEIIKITMAEAGGESLRGKELVISVILNRCESEKFPESVHGVIYQKNAFSPISDGRFNRVKPNEECYQALENVISGDFDFRSESHGALYFESSGSWHASHLEYLFKCGNHRFYK